MDSTRTGDEVPIATSEFTTEGEPVATPGVDPTASPTTDKHVAALKGAILDSPARMAPGKQGLVAHMTTVQTTKQATSAIRARSKRKATPAPEHIISITEQHTEGRPAIPTNQGQGSRRYRDNREKFSQASAVAAPGPSKTAEDYTHLHNQSDLELLALLPPSWRPGVRILAEMLPSPPTSPKQRDET